MAAPIVYQGAITNSGGGGTLFKDLKFWVAHRIPDRTICIQGIENNGGQVVKLEKNADYLIADSARNDAPPHSYSYKFIEDSIEKGSLQDAESYLCQRPVVRPVGSNLPQKRTRTNFTLEDDRILTNWIKDYERRGEPTLGNAPFQILAERYPHHTLQSWRERWIKKLRHLPGLENLNGVPSPPSASPAQSAVQPSPAKGRAPSMAASPQQRTLTQSSIRTRARFTAEEDQLLIQYMRECMARGGYTKGNSIYKDFAQDFPQHTFHSWRDRWLKILAPKMASQIKEWRDEDAEFSDERELATPKAQPPKASVPKARVPITKASTPKASIPKAAAPETSIPTASTPKAPTPKAVATLGTQPNSRLKTPEAHQMDVERRGHHSQQEDASRTKTSLENAQAKNAAVNGSTAASLPHSSPPGVPPGNTPNPVEDEAELEQQFYRDYRSFMENEGRQPVVRQTIQGKSIKLWDLWQAVRSFKMEPADRDWHRITDALGLNWLECGTVPEELRLYYERYLAEFEEAVAQFEGDDSDDEEDSDVDDGEPLPSSPPCIPPSKRPFASFDDPADNQYFRSSPRPKRQKIDRNSEIQSTPDEKNGTSHLRRHNDEMEVSPTRHFSTSTTRPSHAHPRRRISGRNEVGEDDEGLDEPGQLPTLPQTRKHVTEPETQDFQYDPDTQSMVFNTQQDAYNESQSNITPSQQLRSESDAMAADLGSPMLDNDPYEAVQATPTPKRKAKNPFQLDESDEEIPATVNPKGKGVPTDVRTSQQSVSAKPRRSLPRHWASKSASNTSPMSSTAEEISSSRLQPATSPSAPSTHRSPPPNAQKAPIKDTPDDIIDRFLSLGYQQDIVVRALQVTTWHIGNAGQVMEKMRNGDPWDKISGVWTRDDDAALSLVDSAEPPKDAAEEKLRAKKLRRLEKKHGPELMERRRKYLSA
ncbi:TRF2-interacting telomeric protein/Rap1 C terminal domain-containing protein [Xylariomycetidae sp. FL2044]|nr:TRF2-interacting telomeric protein/Rap1 C terminal domain-containing protein [Xylariomycetidae sp. FL2044]